MILKKTIDIYIRANITITILFTKRADWTSTTKALHTDMLFMMQVFKRYKYAP